MTLKPHYSSLFIMLSIMMVFFLVANEASHPPFPSPTPGDWQVIDNVNDTSVVNIGKFAVTEHNRETRKSLRFLNVVKGEMQVVSGTQYRLVINATDGGTTREYSAKVLSQPWNKNNSTQLLSFVLIGSSF
ncbi:hypothetical protein CASFOL_028710 [Castilleja foliolosa]|uniref:Cystatin domain-containing protein n=1 Tax=Castilleja foliolosa TaxID=1961234 RepID=A0ABD3CF88_9LAMI